VTEYRPLMGAPLLPTLDALPHRPVRTTLLALCSFSKRLIDRHGSYMKATCRTQWRVSNRRVGFLSLKIPIPRINLILDHFDVRRRRGWCYVSFGCLGQLFELAFLPTSPEGATP
jgi:hypothetical protein